MHIHDFYAKLVSNNEENPLFAALRKLTLLDDPKAAFSADDNSVDTWVPWVAGNVENPLGELA